MSIQRELVVQPNAEQLAVAALEFLRQRLASSQGEFVLSLAGGSTPKVLYRAMAQTSDLPWSRLRLIWGDERFVPHDHADSNYLMVKETLLDAGHISPDRIHPWPILATPQESAQAYEQLLRDKTPEGAHLALLGMGDDGHTASLFPDTEALGETQRWAVANHVAKLDSWRLTLTYPYFAKCQDVLFLITGAGKRQPLAEVFASNQHPSGKLAARSTVYFFADPAAAGKDA